ncbi:MAG: hypothetical protein JNG89_06640 [Planctomycetaceae bacterium]|nr:hypothetical protein [Planctomycetaceae bacterium]
MTRRINSATRAACALAATGSLFLTGCSKPAFETATVTGTCTCKGEPMTGGLLIFSPQRTSISSTGNNLGKPSHALIQPDGTFTMSTYGDEDGAVVGKHRVELNLAVLEDGDPEQPCEYAAKDLYVEVRPGENHLEIELAPTSAETASR